jgi:maltose phosphorylase
MKKYIKEHPWQIIEEGFYPEYNEITESLMSLGNGRMGQRGNFEEKYSGKTLQGNYVAGVYFPDKTRVGWWKNGYPDYFAKVLNACNWIGINVVVGEEELDLHQCQIDEFERVLDMKTGILRRTVVCTLRSGKQLRVESERFCSMVDDEAGAICYSIIPLNFEDTLTLTPYLDGNIQNRDANYEEKFWNEILKETGFAAGTLVLETKPNAFGVEQFQVATAMQFDVKRDGQSVDFQCTPLKDEKWVGGAVQLSVSEGERVSVYKYAVNLSSSNYAVADLPKLAQQKVGAVARKGFERLRSEQVEAWAAKWHSNDIQIEGDVAAQQGVRFNIFHLQQTYTGSDARLNIGPKGFTGEKYGGSTYWDTEAYCLPFYMSTSGQEVARNLLVYRHNQLGKAIQNAAKLGFTDGAALYPMVTMNGEECHNEWEITFEEIHRNGAIAYAIYDYINYFGDRAYLASHGLEVLLGISRFWAQRVNWSEAKQQYVMLGVTGPNEYENNVNNNWYTNYIAAWTLRYTQEAIAYVQEHHPDDYRRILTLTHFEPLTEQVTWSRIVENMYYPYCPDREVFLQQDGFLDKELLTVEDIKEHRPINQKWSWDRILRSCFIKQADVLQGLYFFEHEFEEDTIRRNFAFYEPMTVHESSLSPCVHAILASRLQLHEKAYEMYLRTARLDLDDYNNDTEDGLHITSMAGSWLSLVKGFAGMRVKDGHLHFAPYLPSQWSSYSFRIGFRGAILKIEVEKEGVVKVHNESTKPLNVFVNQQECTV